MKPVLLLRLAAVLLFLPIPFGVVGFLASAVVGKLASNPSAAGGLATVMALLLGIVCVAAFWIGLALAGAGTVWSLARGDLAVTKPWILACAGLLVLYLVGVWFMARPVDPTFPGTIVTVNTNARPFTNAPPDNWPPNPWRPTTNRLPGTNRPPATNRPPSSTGGQ